MEIEKFEQLLLDIENHFNEELSLQISSENIEDALYILLADKYKFEWRGSLWDVDLSLKDALTLLLEFNFSTLTQVFETNEDLVPSQFVFTKKVRIKSKGLIWIVHKYDADPFPSQPHAHLLERNLKLDLTSGKCYHIREHVHTISKKNLLEIRTKIQIFYKDQLPPLSI